jgi:hypothetical protein
MLACKIRLADCGFRTTPALWAVSGWVLLACDAGEWLLQL